MALFAIADLHLSFGVSKPMDLFGEHWENHPAKIEENWRAKVGPEDTVILPGDFSWGMTFQESARDFQYLENLPGKKILLKGNHDYWWSTASKMKEFFALQGFTTLEILYNNAYLVEGIALAGTRGWMVDDGQDEKQNDKIFNRECGRLELSLQAARKLSDGPLYAFLHYPPVLKNYTYQPMLEIMKKYGVSRCYYGHIHGRAQHGAFCGERDGILFELVACDFLGFSPKEIN